MRYTTIIDITADRAVYRNIHARLLYLHLVLTSGYHDDDRDVSTKSIRQLAMEVGLSVSACRHALHVLIKSGLLKRDGPIWIVRKYILEESITPRAKTKRQAQDQARAASRIQQQDDRDAAMAIDRARRAAMEAQGKTPYMVYYEAQLVKAAAGDVDAQRVVERQRKVYEQHKKAMESKNSKS